MRNTARLVAAAFALASFANGSCAADGTAGDDGAPPLFSAFKTFCLDTWSEPDAVRAKMAQAGLGEPGKTEVIDGVTPGVSYAWAVDWHGERIFVTTYREQDRGKDAYSDLPEVDTRLCGVSTHAPEDASLPLAQQWAGVPRNGAFGEGDGHFFDLKGTEHVPGTGGPPSGGPGWTPNHWCVVTAVLSGKTTLMLVGM